MRFKRSALEQALLLLNYRFRSRKELIGRLEEKKYDRAEIEAAIAQLEKINLVNDDQFAQSLVRNRLELSRRGPFYIRMELIKLGVEKEVIDHALAAVTAEAELESAQNLIQSRSRQWQDLNPLARKRRALSLLQRRGFSASVVKAILTEFK